MGVPFSKSSVQPCVRVIIYEDRNECPRTFWIPLIDNRIIFLLHPFPSVTQFPRLPYSVYDIYKEYFVEIGTFMAMDATFGENPFLILRQSELRDDECPYLGDRINELKNLISMDPGDLQYGTSAPYTSISRLLFKTTIAAVAFLIGQCIFILAWVWNAPEALQCPQEPIQSTYTVVQPQRTVFVELSSSSESDECEDELMVKLE
ncbi:hypothetical protein NP233_g1030 [Leucocoprinus birnbaumii]|uniref:Uncharacterized protein n=1 Tax=Leucocoprinus birnbaumii TaxID=56174 RepID=A0AAD5YY98_9AGAR|nr:hypothetical protein NP233_g1030 [Leucocoprinus birnbaumii]